MSKQVKLFKEVRNRYPDYTYKMLAEHFDIQQTRLFRLMSGTCELKASEYFVIKSKLETEGSEIQNLINFLEKHSFSINKRDCSSIVQDLENKLLIRSLTKTKQVKR